LSRSGDGPLYLLLAIVLYLFEPVYGKEVLSCLAMAFFIEIPIYTVIKKTIKRSRPFEKLPGIKHLIQPPDQFSFPFGRTAAAFLTATILATSTPTLMVFYSAGHPSLVCQEFIWVSISQQTF